MMLPGCVFLDGFDSFPLLRKDRVSVRRWLLVKLVGFYLPPPEHLPPRGLLVMGILIFFFCPVVDKLDVASHPLLVNVAGLQRRRKRGLSCLGPCADACTLRIQAKGISLTGQHLTSCPAVPVRSWRLPIYLPGGRSQLASCKYVPHLLPLLIQPFTGKGNNSLSLSLLRSSRDLVLV